MSTICLTSPTLTSIRVASSPTVITTTSNLVVTPEGHFTNVTFTTCVPVSNTPIFKRQQGCSVLTTSAFIPGVPVTRQVPVQVTTTQFQTFSTTLFGTSCSVSSLPASPPSSLSSSVSSSSLIPDPASSQSVSKSSSTTTRTTSLRVVPVPIATSGSSTVYSYSTSYITSDTADGAQPTDAVEPSSQDSSTNRLKVVGGVCGSILGAILLGVVGYFLFKKLTHAYKYKSDDWDHLRQIDPEPQDQHQSGLDPHYDQSQGAPHLQDPAGYGMQGPSFAHDGMQGQGGSFMPDASAGQGQGGAYAYPYGQDAGQYTYVQGPESQGMQGQGMDYSSGQGQGTPYQPGVEQYNPYGGQADGMQHYAPQPNDVQSQNPFADAPGPQDQMSQLPSVQAGSSSAAAAGASFVPVLPAAIVAHRHIFGKRNVTGSVRSPKQQHRPNPF